MQLAQTEGGHALHRTTGETAAGEHASSKGDLMVKDELVAVAFVVDFVLKCLREAVDRDYERVCLVGRPLVLCRRFTGSA